MDLIPKLRTSYKDIILKTIDFVLYHYVTEYRIGNLLGKQHQFRQWFLPAEKTKQ